MSPLLGETKVNASSGPQLFLLAEPQFGESCGFVQWFPTAHLDNNISELAVSDFPKSRAPDPTVFFSGSGTGESLRNAVDLFSNQFRVRLGSVGGGKTLANRYQSGSSLVSCPKNHSFLLKGETVDRASSSPKIHASGDYAL